MRFKVIDDFVFAGESEEAAETNAGAEIGLGLGGSKGERGGGTAVGIIEGWEHGDNGAVAVGLDGGGEVAEVPGFQAATVEGGAVVGGAGLAEARGEALHEGGDVA